MASVRDFLYKIYISAQSKQEMPLTKTWLYGKDFKDALYCNILGYWDLTGLLLQTTALMNL